MAIMETVAHRIGGVLDRATTNTIYGETRIVNGVEMIPVASVKGGFGMGGGSGAAGHGEDAGAEGEGGGGCGGLKVTPVALVTVRDGEPHVVPVIDRNQIVRTAGFIAGIAVFFIGLILSRLVKPRR